MDHYVVFHCFLYTTMGFLVVLTELMLEERNIHKNLPVEFYIAPLMDAVKNSLQNCLVNGLMKFIASRIGIR